MRKEILKISYLKAGALKRMIERREDFLLVDVRQPSLFERKHIEGAISIPAAVLNYKNLPENKLIVVYCATRKCPASRDAAAILVNRGYKKVAILKGGLSGWEQTGGHVVKKSEKIQKHLIPGITADEIKNNKAADKIVLFDIRPAEEYRAGHIKGAKSISRERLVQAAEKIPQEKDIVLYTRSDGESWAAADELIKKGNKNVKILSGGFLMWQKGGNAVVSGNEK